MKRKVKRAVRTETRYINRPSQITRHSPTKRLKKRRRKNLSTPKKGFFPNPRPKLYIITARGKGRGPKMHYDGLKFSQRPRVVTYPSAAAAAYEARELLENYPVLRRYTVAVEPNF